MITTTAYPGYTKNPPAISFMGRKTWDPGRSLQTFVTVTFGVTAREQIEIVEQIGTAMSEVGPLVREAMAAHVDFTEIGSTCCGVGTKVSQASGTSEATVRGSVPA